MKETCDIDWKDLTEEERSKLERALALIKSVRESVESRQPQISIVMAHYPWMETRRWIVPASSRVQIYSRLGDHPPQETPHVQD